MSPEVSYWVTALVVAAIAGWAAGHLMKIGGLGLALNIIVGIIGGALGSIIMQKAGVSLDGIMGQIIVSTLGAIILLAIVGFLRKLSR